MSVIIQAIIFIVSLIGLSKFSHITIKSSSNIARITRIGELSVGLILLSTITSYTELMGAIIKS